MTRRNAWTAVLLVCAITAGICLLTAPDAGAVTVRDDPAPPVGRTLEWSFKGRCCITSKPFTQTRPADITITASLTPCKTRDGRTRFVLGVWEGTRFVAAKTIRCSGTLFLRKAQPGTYRWRLMLLDPFKDARTYTGSGQLIWDGAHL